MEWLSARTACRGDRRERSRVGRRMPTDRLQELPTARPEDPVKERQSKFPGGAIQSRTNRPLAPTSG